MNGAPTFLSLEHRVFIKQVELRELRMQLLHPFETSFGVTQQRRILLVKVTDGTQAGYGEVTAGEGPFYSHEKRETAWPVLPHFIIPGALGRKKYTAGAFTAFCSGIRGYHMAKTPPEPAFGDIRGTA